MRAIKNWVLATFILTFLVIIAGGIVRTTQSGMGCPDWPRCFGKWIPPTNASELPVDFERYLSKQDIDHTFNVYHTWIEYFNRLFGVLLGVFAIIQVALLFRRKKEMKGAYQLAIAFLVTVILTGLFGALVVKLNLAHFSISVHLLFALILTQLQLALVLSLKNKMNTLIVPARVKTFLISLLALIIFQSVLGTMVRIYIDDISKHLDYQQRETWLVSSPVAFLIHRSFSWAVLLATLAFAWYCRRFSVIKNKVYLLTVILLLSMATGIILFYLDMPAVAQPIHLLLATLGITQVFNIMLQLRTKTSAE